MQIVGAAGQCLALEPFLTPVGAAGALGIGELPDAGRRGHVKGTIMPQRPFGKHHRVGKDHTLVESTILLGALQADNTMRFLFELNGHFFIGTRGIADIEAALIIKIRRDRAVNQRGTGKQRDIEPQRQSERVPIESNDVRRDRLITKAAGDREDPRHDSQE